MYNGPNLETTNGHQQENEDAIVVYSYSEIFLSIKNKLLIHLTTSMSHKT